MVEGLTRGLMWFRDFLNRTEGRTALGRHYAAHIMNHVTLEAQYWLKAEQAETKAEREKHTMSAMKYHAEWIDSLYKLESMATGRRTEHQ